MFLYSLNFRGGKDIVDLVAFGLVICLPAPLPHAHFLAVAICARTWPLLRVAMLTRKTTLIAAARRARSQRDMIFILFDYLFF